MNLQLFRTTVALLTIGAMTLIPTTARAADTETINSQVTQQKEIDSGGSGFYRAIVVSEKTLQHFTVYRPRNVQYAARREGPLPVFIWFNGACSGDNTGYEHLLNHIASHGYVVVAIGAFKMTDKDAGDSGSDYTQFSTAVSWLVQQEKKVGSDYYHAINTKNIAVSGHSCGGAQALANCTNSRVKTLLIMNAGMGGMSMGGASPETLNKLHCPLIYMTGGTSDQAYGNAQTDFGKVKSSVPVVWADLSNAGHYGSSYWSEYGGEYGKIALKWIDWHLKGYKQNARIFLKPDLKGFDSHWVLKSRNFMADDKNYDEPYGDIETVADSVFDRSAADSVFDFGADISSLSKLTNKVYYNKEGKSSTLMPILKEQGVNSVRLRVLVSPSKGTYNTLYAKSLANTAKSQGFGIMADLHYCDWWGDNVKPKAWASYEPEKLLKYVKAHTAAAVKSLNATGMLRWVQIGNEVDEGFLWNDGRETANFVSYVNAAYDTIKAINPAVQTVIHVSKCEDTKWLTDYFDNLQQAGAKWDAIGLSVHVKASALTPTQLIATVADNVRVLKQRYGKPVLIVETGYYNDRQLEANQWLCDFLVQLMEAGASGLYYWEPELVDDYDLGAWNPLTRKPSLAMDAFLGLRHQEGSASGVSTLTTAAGDDVTEYYSPSGMKIAHLQRGLNIVRRKTGGTMKTYKIHISE